MKKFVALQTREKRKSGWQKDDSDILGALYIGYKKLGQFFSRTYLLTYLKKDTPNLLEVINIGKSS